MDKKNIKDELINSAFIAILFSPLIIVIIFVLAEVLFKTNEMKAYFILVGVLTLLAYIFIGIILTIKDSNHDESKHG